MSPSFCTLTSQAFKASVAILLSHCTRNKDEGILFVGMLPKEPRKVYPFECCSKNCFYFLTSIRSKSGVSFFLLFSLSSIQEQMWPSCCHTAQGTKTRVSFLLARCPRSQGKCILFNVAQRIVSIFVNLHKN